jgi:hypothetical protein
MFLRFLNNHVLNDWMLGILVLFIALWGIALDVLSVGDRQIAAERPRLEQVALTDHGK